MDWRMASFILSVVTSFSSLIMFIILKFNDMKHLGISLEKLETKVTDVENRVIENGERVACLEGKMLARLGKKSVRRRKKIK